MPKGSVPDFDNSHNPHGVARTAGDQARPQPRPTGVSNIAFAGAPGTPASPSAEASPVRLCILALALALGLSALTRKQLGHPTAAAVGDDLFRSGQVTGIAVELPAEGLQRLRSEPRRYVHATVRSGTGVWTKVAVRLKGSTGSYRGLDDKPSFTLDFDRWSPGQRFHGLSRLQLNNSVEDPSFLHEVLGAELFRSVGIPAPRVGHARVTLNDRPLGLFVLKEGFTREFLAAHFARADGALYDNDAGCDVDQVMHRNLADQSLDRRCGLEAAAAAAAESDPEQRWVALERALDMDRFVTFVAIEVMLGHRDGYSCGRNNFRIYHDPAFDRLVFLPDGMDQLFGLADFPWRPRMSGLMAAAVMGTEAGQEMYEARFRDLLDRVLVGRRLCARVDAEVESLRAWLTPAEYREIRGEATALKTRIIERHARLEAQLERPELARVKWSDGEAELEGGWVAWDADSAREMSEGLGPDGRADLRIVAGTRTSADWRMTVLLEPGRYRFEGRVRVLGVTALPFGREQGAGLRVGGAGTTGDRLVGDSDWRVLSAEFEVGEAVRAVELRCELRAAAGQMWVDRASLRLTKLSESSLDPEAMRGGRETGRASLPASRVKVGRTTARQEPRPAGPRFMERTT